MAGKPMVLNVAALVQGPRPKAINVAALLNGGKPRNIQRLNVASLVRGPSPTVLRPAVPARGLVSGMPEPLTARKSASKPCCDDCGKAEAVGRPKPCGGGSARQIVPHGLQTRLPAQRAVGRMTQYGFTPRAGLWPPQSPGARNYRPFDNDTCFTPFTPLQHACLDAAWQSALSASFGLVGEGSSRTLWEQVLMANGHDDVSAAYQRYNTAWTDAWASAASRCLGLFPADVRVGPMSVLVQVTRAMDVSVPLNDGNGNVLQHTVFHGWGGIPDGWTDPLCGRRILNIGIERSTVCPDGYTFVHVPLDNEEYLREVVQAVNEAFRVAYETASLVADPGDVAQWNAAFEEAFVGSIGAFGAGAGGISDYASTLINNIFTAGAAPGHLEGSYALLATTRDNTGRDGARPPDLRLLGWVRLPSDARIRRSFDHLIRRRCPRRSGSGLGISALA